MKARICVIGVGAVGRQVALMLPAIGATDVTLIDFDKVEEVNITTQGYKPAQLGFLKVDATWQDMLAIEPTIAVTVHEDRFGPEYGPFDAVFCCVDSIDDRKTIWSNIRNRCVFWCDARMMGETLQIYAAAVEAEKAMYDQSFFPAEETQEGRCTARSTIYVASIAAAMMIHQFTRWLRQIELDTDLTLNLLSSELTTKATFRIPVLQSVAEQDG